MTKKKIFIYFWTFQQTCVRDNSRHHLSIDIKTTVEWKVNVSVRINNTNEFSFTTNKRTNAKNDAKKKKKIIKNPNKTNLDSFWRHLATKIVDVVFQILVGELKHKCELFFRVYDVVESVRRTKAVVSDFCQQVFFIKRFSTTNTTYTHAKITSVNRKQCVFDND